MFINHFGEFIALLTAICWTFTALAFESAGRKVGSLPVNIIRLSIAFVLLGLYTYSSRGLFFPSDADLRMWLWLSLSGFIGFVIGDLFLFKSYLIIGARISMLVMSLVPPLTALIGWLLMGEILSIKGAFGMFVTITGVTIVILQKKKNPDDNNLKIKVSYPVKGLLFAFGGALGQAGGLVLSKYGMGSYNAFAATQIRVITGIIGFIFIVTFLKRWVNVKDAFKNKEGMLRISIGSVFGPFLGVSFSLLAVQYTTTGVASTIMAIIPVLIIIPSVLIFKEKPTWKEILGAFIAVGGVGVLFL
ncbi:MAG: DMT family transporter [Bacteroidales bacterium]|nr:DMT family transporter [Bacteroidales bacterium]